MLIFTRYSIIIAVLLLTAFSPAAVRADKTRENDPQFKSSLKRWQSFSEEKRQAIRARARGLTRGELEEYKQKLAAFKELPAEDQERMQRNHRHFHGLSESAQKKLRGRFARFSQLSEENRNALRQRCRGRGGANGANGHGGAQGANGHGRGRKNRTQESEDTQPGNGPGHRGIGPGGEDEEKDRQKGQGGGRR